MGTYLLLGSEWGPPGKKKLRTTGLRCSITFNDPLVFPIKTSERKENKRTKDNNTYVVKRLSCFKINGY